MNKEYIEKLQEYALSLVGYTGYKPRHILVSGICSEVSRLLALKILKERGELSSPAILKGRVTKTGLNKDNMHDILIYIDNTISNKKPYILLDPTVWQFFPRKKSILMNNFSSIKQAVEWINKKYGGDWKISETITNKNRGMIKEWSKIVKGAN